MSNRLRIGITQGDTNGVGWEVILKIFSDNRLAELCTPVIYGSSVAAAFYQKRLKEYEPVKFNIVEGARRAHNGKVNLVECGAKDLFISPGKPSKAGGEAAAAALRVAIDDLKEGNIDALVTAPIDKEMIQSEEFCYTGHTEFLAKELDGTPLMIMTSELMRVGLATIHVPVASIAEKLSKELILERIEQMDDSMKRDFGVVAPRIAVMALNPHAGDGGLLGKEEQEIIKPAIVEAYEKNILAFGPFAADGFFASGQFKNYDAILAMYHDQGLAPFKTLSPDGVNFTASLSAVRTSPDHGVAYDIAGQGVANEQSMRNAIYDAIDIVRRRDSWEEWNDNPLEHFEREKGRDISIKDLPDTDNHHDHL
jgi:4-hydroxythreonine-4-phosphate dehydrogenase